MNPFWLTRSKADAQAYWDTRAAGYRGLLASMLHPLAPFASLLEIGAHSGPNLWAIRQQFPTAHLLGLEPSEACANFGQVKAAAEAMERMSPVQARALSDESHRRGEIASVGTDFFIGQAPAALQDFHDIDIVLSCYTLAYLTEAELHQTLTDIVRIAHVGVLLVEPMLTDTEPEGPIQGASVPARRHGYGAWFAAHAPDWHVELLSFPGPQELNRALRAKRVV